MSAEEERQAALNSYRAKLIESREWEAKLKNLRLEIKDMQREFDKTEDNIKALQSVGQIIGEVLKQLDDERCKANTIWTRTRWTHANSDTHSHCQGLLRTPIRCRMQIKGGQG